MTAALLVLLVLLLTIGAASAVLSARRKGTPAMPPTPAPTEAAAALPLGHDDPGSLSYVPAELRDHWPAEGLDRLDGREADDRYGHTARRDVWWSDPRHRAEWTSRARHRSDYLPTVWQLSGYLSDRYNLDPQRPLDDVEHARALHLLLLERARAAYVEAEQLRRNAEQRAAHTCPACRGWARAAGDLCQTCEQVAASERLRMLESQTLDDGRTRLDAVRAHLHG
jgi:hypothetical protein